MTPHCVVGASVKPQVNIICAHCNCMASLGEANTHIAAVLLHTEADSRMRGSTTCTQLECQWVIPSYQKDMTGTFHFTSSIVVQLNQRKLKSILLLQQIQQKTPLHVIMSVKKTTALSITPGQDELQSFEDTSHISQCRLRFEISRKRIATVTKDHSSLL